MKLNTPLLIVIGILILGGLFFALKPKATDMEHHTPDNTVKTNSNVLPSDKSKSNNFELVVKEKKLVSGPELIKVSQGSEIEIKITSDVADEFHIHGYDKSVELEIDKPVTIKFTADISGRFPFELENSKTELGNLEVQPK